MNYLLWFQLLSQVAGVVARENGVAPRELAYLAVLTRLVGSVNATERDLLELRNRYEAEVATDAPVTPQELLDIAARIEARLPGSAEVKP